MSTRNPRYIPDGGSLVEVTCRVIQGRFLLRPSRELNEIVAGVLARARERCPAVEVIAAVFLSNHYHLLLWVESAGDLAEVMCYLNGNLAREVNRLHGWSDRLWRSRYTSIPVSHEEAAQVARLTYLLSHGAKEDLVPGPADWPGVHTVREMMAGEPLRGVWFDRTAESAAGRKREKRSGAKRPGRYDHAEKTAVPLAKLPCWRHLSDSEYRRRIRTLVNEIEARQQARRRAEGTRLPGPGACRKRILRQHPHTSPANLDRRPPPAFHTATPEARREMKSAFRLFLDAYRVASERLRAGDTEARFPAGCFPPAAPFVGRKSAIRAP